MERMNNFQLSNETIQDIKTSVEKLKDLLIEQFNSDMEHLKLYASEAGTVRLDMLGSAVKLCESMVSRFDIIETCLKKAVDVGSKLEIK